MKIDLSRQKRSVRFSVTDGVLPRQNEDGLFDLLAPMGITFVQGMSMRIDLGVSCDLPVMVFSRAQGPDVFPTVFDVGMPIIVTLVARHDVSVERGEPIVRAFILDNRDIVKEH